MVVEVAINAPHEHGSASAHCRIFSVGFRVGRGTRLALAIGIMRIGSLAAAAIVLAAPASVFAQPKAALEIRKGVGKWAAQGIERHVKRALEAHGYVTAAESASYVIAPAVTKVDITRSAVACSIAIRVAPRDANGQERWEAQQTTTAFGNATLSTEGALRPDQVARWTADCIETATGETLRRRVVPFLERLDATPPPARAASREVSRSARRAPPGSARSQQAPSRGAAPARPSRP